MPMALHRHVELLQHILGVLRLVDEGALLALLDLKSMKEVELTYHQYLKLSAHSFCKRDHKCMRRATKNDIIHVNLNK